MCFQLAAHPDLIWLHPGLFYEVQLPVSVQDYGQLAFVAFPNSSLVTASRIPAVAHAALPLLATRGPSGPAKGRSVGRSRCLEPPAPRESC